MDDLAERVARGAALLDERRPGWAKEIIPDLLAMEDCNDCILGQLYDDFLDGIETLRLADGVSRGFELRQRQADEGLYDELAALWRAEVARRLSPQEAPRA